MVPLSVVLIPSHAFTSEKIAMSKLFKMPADDFNLSYDRVFATTRGRTGPIPLGVGHPGMCEESIWCRALSSGCLRRLGVRKW